MHVGCFAHRPLLAWPRNMLAFIVDSELSYLLSQIVLTKYLEIKVNPILINLAHIWMEPDNPSKRLGMKYNTQEMSGKWCFVPETVFEPDDAMLPGKWCLDMIACSAVVRSFAAGSKSHIDGKTGEQEAAASDEKTIVDIADTVIWNILAIELT